MRGHEQPRTGFRAFLRTRAARRLMTAGTLGVSGLLVWQSTAASFTASTTNPSNSMTAGTVTISDNDSGTALFTTTGMVPGATGNNCILVTYSGTATSTIKLYTANYLATDGAADGATLPTWLKMNIQVGTGTCGAPIGLTDVTAASPGDTFTTISAKTSFANGYGTGWTAATAGNTRVFKFTYTLDSSTPNTSTGDNITTDFVWTATNN